MLERQHLRPHSFYRVIAAGICSLVLTVGMARFAYTPLLPVMQVQAGLTGAIGGWLASLNYAGYMVGTILAATLTSASLKYRLYRSGLLAAVLSTVGMGLTDNALAWAVLRFAAGLSSAAGMILGSSLVLDWLVRRGRRPELGLHFAGMGLGIVATGIVVAATAGRLDWRQQWLAMGVLGAGLLVPAWIWMPALPGEGSVGVRPQGFVGPSRRWLQQMTMAYFCAGFGYVVSGTFLVAVAEGQPGLAGSGGAVWIAVGLAAIPACLVWDRVARHIGEVRALMLAYAIQVVSILLSAWGNSIAITMLAAALYGATFIGIVGVTLTLVGRRNPENPARSMARLTLSYGAAQVFAPALAGGIAEATGSYRGALYVAATVVTAGMVLLAMLHRTEVKNALQAAEQSDSDQLRPIPPREPAITTGGPFS